MSCLQVCCQEEWKLEQGRRIRYKFTHFFQTFQIFETMDSCFSNIGYKKLTSKTIFPKLDLLVLLIIVKILSVVLSMQAILHHKQVHNNTVLVKITRPIFSRTTSES